MSSSAATSSTDRALLVGVLRRIAGDLGMMIGQDIAFEEPAVERANARPAGGGVVHISFKLALAFASGTTKYGALLLPLPEAITLAGLLLMIPEESVAARRGDPAPDATLKAAMLEIASMIGGSTSTALEEFGVACTARSEGCQGVRAEVRPAFPYREGEELLVARVRMRVHTYPEFEALLVLPVPE